MNGHKLTNLGAPVNASDSATKSYVDGVKSFSTGLTISGADVNGQLNFSSVTGANGLAFVGADLSWLARLATAAGPGTPPVPPATLNRLVLNTKPDGSGTDVITANDDGSINANGQIIASPIVGAKAASGNVHLWLYGPNGEDRMVLYTTAASAGATTLRVTGTQSFNFATDGTFHSPGSLYASSAAFQTDGNITGGSIWANFSGGHTDAYTAISAQIESRATAWANDRVSNLQYRKVSQTNITIPTGADTFCMAPAGAVVNGVHVASQWKIDTVYFMYLQVYDPVRGWVGFSG
jgi:hypothetical protein